MSGMEGKTGGLVGAQAGIRKQNNSSGWTIVVIVAADCWYEWRQVTLQVCQPFSAVKKGKVISELEWAGCEARQALGNQNEMKKEGVGERIEK